MAIILTKDDIIQGNKLIRAFMYDWSLEDIKNHPKLPKYHQDWNELIKVVEKISSTIDFDNYDSYYRIIIKCGDCYITTMETEKMIIEKDGANGFNPDPNVSEWWGHRNVWEACVDFSKYFAFAITKAENYPY